MHRRTFLTVPAGAAFLQAQTPAAETPRAVIELRYYHVRSGPQTQKTTTYLQRGLFPALERAGVRPTGAFNALIGPDTPFLLTLVSYPSLAAIEATRERLAADKELQAAFDTFNTVGELSYIRMESSLLWAFPFFPSVAPPPTAPDRPARIFELRTYESAHEKGQAAKIRMFGGGEFDIFRRHGLLAVFAGQTVVGTHMPSLTYMLGFDDWDARDKGWTGFQSDPEWQKLRTRTEGMADGELVSNISNALLRPLPFSTIR